MCVRATLVAFGLDLLAGVGAAFILGAPAGLAAVHSAGRFMDGAPEEVCYAAGGGEEVRDGAMQGANGGAHAGGDPCRFHSDGDRWDFAGVFGSCGGGLAGTAGYGDAAGALRVCCTVG